MAVFQQNAEKANLPLNVLIVLGMSVVAGKPSIKNRKTCFTITEKFNYISLIVIRKMILDRKKATLPVWFQSNLNRHFGAALNGCVRFSPGT